MYDVKAKATTPIEKLEELSETILDNVDDKVCEFKDNLDDLESTVDNQSSDIAELENTLSYLEGTVDDLTSRLDELEAKLEELTDG